MDRLICVINALVLLAIVCEYCKAQGDKIDLMEKRSHNIVKNNLNEVGLQRDFLNLNVKSKKEENKNQLKYINGKNENLDMLQTSNTRKKEENKYFNNVGNMAIDVHKEDVRPNDNKNERSHNIVDKNSSKRNSRGQYWNLNNKEPNERLYKTNTFLGNPNELMKPNLKNNQPNNKIINKQLIQQREGVLNNVLEGNNHDKQIKINEHATNRHKDKLSREINNNIKDKSEIKGSPQIQEIHNPYHVFKNVDDGKHKVRYRLKHDRSELIRPLNELNIKIQPDNSPGKMFVKRGRLPRLSMEGPKDSRVHLKEPVTTSSQTTQSTCTIERGRPISFKGSSKSLESTEKTSLVKSENNTNTKINKQYESFLTGELVDEFMNSVFKKVKRSRKIMMELGFGNNTEGACDRCAELKDNNIPELEEMKQQVEMFSTKSRTECYKIPAKMDEYLDILMSNKQENTSSLYKKAVDEGFIFAEDIESLDNESGNIDISESSGSLGKQKLHEDNIEVRVHNQSSNGKDTNISKLTNKSKLSEEAKSRELYKNSLKVNNDLNQKVQQSKTQLTQNKNAHNDDFVRTGHERVGGYGLKTNEKDSSGRNQDIVRELDRSTGKTVRKRKYDIDSIDYDLENKGLNDPDYEEEFTGVQGRRAPYNNNLPWRSSNQQDKGDNINNIADNFLRHHSMSVNMNDKGKEDDFGVVSNDYVEGIEYMENPKYYKINWKNGEYQLYPKGLDLYDSQLAIPSISKEYNDMNKGENQLQLEPYKDDSSNDSPDDEYGIY